MKLTIKGQGTIDVLVHKIKTGYDPDDTIILNKKVTIQCIKRFDLPENLLEVELFVNDLSLKLDFIWMLSTFATFTEISYEEYLLEL